MLDSAALAALAAASCAWLGTQLEHEFELRWYKLAQHRQA